MSKISFGQVWDSIQKVREEKGKAKAIELANEYLSKDPFEVQAYMQLIDMYYIMGELDKAEKPIDFILKNNLEGNGIDKGLLYYIKAVLLSERTEWNEAKKNIKKALKYNEKNLEYKRLLYVAEFWSGNKENGYLGLKDLLDGKILDADIIVDAITMALSLGYLDDAKNFVNLYYDKKGEISFFSKNVSYYDKKMENFKQFLFSDKK